MKKEFTYAEAEKSALDMLLATNNDIVLMGQGINDENAMFGVTDGLWKKYGTERIFDTPLAETGLAGVGIGLAMNEFRVLYMHNRPDFLYLSFDQIINHASKYSYMSDGSIHVPIVFWAVTGQGWGCAAQHSQSIHGILNQVPGLKIIMPTTPYDAKGLLKTALEDNSPVLFLEHRRLFNQKQYIECEEYNIPIGKGVIRKIGKDVTIVAISAMILDVLAADEILSKEGINIEIIDLRTIKPYDKDIIIKSVKKTGRLVIADTSWITGSVAKDIAETMYYELFDVLKQKIEIVALPDIPTPAAFVLEDVYYKTCKDICEAVYKVMED